MEFENCKLKINKMPPKTKKPAKKEMLDSKWANQTPERANKLSERMGNAGAGVPKCSCSIE